MAKKRGGHIGRKGEKVLHEFKMGTLRSSSGGKVRSREQALAIAFSSQRKADRRRRKKR